MVNPQVVSLDGYRRLLEEFVAGAPTRVYGLGQVAVRSIEETVDDFIRIKEAGFKGVARALRDAVSLDPRVVGVPSTKGTLTAP